MFVRFSLFFFLVWLHFGLQIHTPQMEYHFAPYLRILMQLNDACSRARASKWIIHQSIGSEINESRYEIVRLVSSLILPTLMMMTTIAVILLWLLLLMILIDAFLLYLDKWDMFILCTRPTNESNPMRTFNIKWTMHLSYSQSSYFSITSYRSITLFTYHIHGIRIYQCRTETSSQIKPLKMWNLPTHRHTNSI